MKHAAESEVPIVAPVAGTGPYKFLDYYVEDDKTRFAGRERDIEELVARVMTDRVSVLYGRSGLGKTSLLLAGVFPEVRLRGIQPVYVRVLESPLQDACRALASTFNFEADTGPDQLETKLGAISPAPRILLVLDQFEEFFIRFKKQTAEKRTFSKWLARLSHASPLDFRALISLREEYLSRLDEFADDLPDMFGNEYRLRPLTAFGARQAITRPLVETGTEFDQRLVNRVVDALAAEDFDSLLLQIVCSAIYREAATRNEEHVRLKERDLEGVGGLEGILRRYLDAATQTVEPKHLVLCRTILDALITPEATKRAVTLNVLLQADFTATKEEVETLLQSLEKWRLVRKEVRGEQVWYELTHERLVRHILDWFQLDRTFVDFRVARDLVSVSSKGELFRERPNTLLVPGQIEDVVGAFRERLRLDPVQTEFMFWSTVYRQTPSVGYWAKALGEEKSRQALLAMFKLKDDGARCGAAAAARQIPDTGRELAKQCLDHALNDPDEQVRRAAGQSLALLAGPEQIEVLKASVKHRATSRKARDVLADIRLSGHDLRDFSFLAKLRAQRAANRRLLKLYSETARDRAKLGRLSGLIAGLIWVCSAGFALTVMLSWLKGAIPIWGFVPPAGYLAGWGMLIPVALGFATFFGWNSARRAARREALGDKSFYSLGLTGTLILAAVALAGALLVLVPYIKEGSIAFSDSDFWQDIGFLLTWYVLLRTALKGLVFFGSPSVWPARMHASIWAWGFVQCLGFPLLLPGLLALVLARSTAAHSVFAAVPVFTFAVIAASLLSLASFVLLVALPRAALRFPLRQVKPEITVASNLSRWWGLLGILSFVCWFVFAFGRTSVPFTAGPPISEKPSSPSPGAAVTTQIVASWPNSRYLRFQVDDGTGQWFRVTAAPSSAYLHFRNKGSESDLGLAPAQYVYGGKNAGIFLFVPGGKHLASLSVNSSEAPEPDRTLTLKTLQDYAKSLPLGLDATDQFWYLTFTRDSSSSPWSVDFSGSLSPGTFTADQAIRVSFFKPVPVALDTQQSFEGMVSEQETGHGACMLRSKTPVEIPLSLAGFVFAPDGPSLLAPGWLEIPIGEGGGFHVHLQLVANSTEPEPQAAAGTRQVFSLERGKVELPSNRFTVAAALHLVDTPRTLNNEIVRLIQKGSLAEAIARARKVVAAWPYDDCSRNNLAWGLVGTRQYAEALQVALEAVQLNAQSPEIQDTLAHAAYGVGDWSRAAKAWENGEALDPNFFAHRSEQVCLNDRKLYDEAKRRASKDPVSKK